MIPFSRYLYVSAHPSTHHRVIVAVVVVDEAELGVIELAGPLDGLFDTASRRTVGALAWQAIGGVGVAGAKGTVVAVYFANVLRQIPAVGEPGAVLLERQRAGGIALRGKMKISSLMGVVLICLIGAYARVKSLRSFFICPSPYNIV